MEMLRASGSPRRLPAAPRAERPAATACGLPDRVPARLPPGRVQAVEPTAMLMRAFHICPPGPATQARAFRGWIASGPLRRA